MRSTRVTTIRVLIGFFALLMMTKSFAAESPYWDFSIYGTQDPQKLMQISIDSESLAEKLRIRSFMAKNYANRMEGLAAQAWMAGYEGHPEESKKLYLDCVQRYPKFGLCINNVVADNPKDLVLAQKFLDADPSFFDYSPIRAMFSRLGEAGKVQEQKAFFKSVEQEYAGSWLIPFLVYMEAGQRNDKAAQREALRQAISIEGQQPPFMVYKLLIGLETGYFFQGDRDRLDIATEMVVQYLTQTRRFDEYEPWQYLMDEFAGTDVTKLALLRQFVKTYDMYAQFSDKGKRRPIPVEALDIVTNRGEGNANIELAAWFKQLRERFAARRATEPEVNKLLLWFETATDGSLQTLMPQWQALVDNALTEKDAAGYAISALHALTTLRGDCTAAQRLTTGLDKRLAGSAHYQRNAFDAALCANDLVSARKRLDAVAQLDPGQSASDRSDRMRLAQAEAQAKAWNEQESRNPFLKQWDGTDGGQVAINIEFASGTALIPKQYDEPLNKLARLLKENGAEDYQFDIAGHTDSRGSAELNQRLSEQRAKAVVDYLVAKTGIESGRLTYSGHGSAFPVASNDTDAGMQQNRRVEITPRANLRAPVLAQEGTPDGSVTISPDGRLLATSDALWDIKTRLKMRDLPAVHLRQMNFLPNGRVLVRMTDMKWPSSTESAIEVIDVASGLVMHRQLTLGSTDSFSVSPDGRKLALVIAGQVQVYALPSLQLRKQRMLSVIAGSGKIAWLGNDRLATSVRFGGEKLHLLNANTLDTQKVFDDIDYVHTIAVSRTGKTLIAITNAGGTLHTWDTKSWKHKEMGLDTYADRFVFHPFEEKVIINQWNGNDLKSRLIDLETMQVVKTFADTVSAAFAADGRSFFLGGKEYDLASFEAKPWSQSKTSINGASFGMWLPEKGQFTTEDDKDSQLWDVTSGRQIDQLVGMRECGKVNGSQTLFWKCGTDHSVMVERGSWRTIANPNSFKKSDTQSVEAETASRVVVFEHDPAPSKGRVAKRGKLSIIDRVSGSTLSTYPVLLRLEDAIYASDDALDSGDVTTAVDPTGRYLAMRVWWKEHWGYAALSSKQVWLFDLETGKEIDRISLNLRAEKISFAPGNTPKLRVGFDSYTGFYDLTSKEWGKHEPWSSKETLWAESGSLQVVSLGEKLTLLNGSEPERYVFLRKSPSGVELYPIQNLMLVYYGNGEFDYYDLKTLSRQLTLQAKSKGEWLAYAPSGEFSSSLNGSEGYYWSLGDKYIPFGALRERFELPNIIARQLQKVVKGTAVAPVVLAATSLRQDNGNSQPNSGNASSEAIEADLFMPPFSLRLIDPPTMSNEAKMTLKVGITKLRAIGVEPEIELNINGQQVNSRALRRVSESKTCEDTKEKVNCEQIIELPLNITDGRNEVAVSLLYRNARLETKNLVIELNRSQLVGQAKPRLWIFAAGVSEYADSNQNLKFADRDAEELSKMFKSQEGKLYSQVNTKVLTNQQVLKGTLDNEINRFLRQASEQDLIVILLAGHGLQDTDQALYFATHDTTLEEAYSGMEVARIHSILKNRPANQKAILLLDICHAGALGEAQRSTVNSGDAIKLLGQGTGVTMLSSSTGRELSNESTDFLGGHGAFTAAAIEGLMGAADKESGNRDGIVTVVELSLYIQRRVSELTHNTQHSTMSFNGQDYPLATAQ